MVEQLSAPPPWEVQLLKNGFSRADIIRYPATPAYKCWRAHYSEGPSVIAISVQHTNDPKSGLFGETGEIDAALLELSGNTEVIGITEGGVRQYLDTDSREAIIRKGEQQYATNRAHELGVPVVSGEPGIDREIHKVLEEMGDTEETWHALADYYVKRMGPQLFRGVVSQAEADESFWRQFTYLREKYDSLRQKKETGVVNLLEDKSEQTFRDRYGGLTMNLTSVKAMFDETVGHMMQQDRHFVHEDENDVVKVSRIINTLRDDNLKERVQSYLTEGKSVFVIYGKAHIDAIRQELGLEPQTSTKMPPMMHPYQQLIQKH